MRYYDDTDEISRRFRPKHVAPRPTFEERVTALERKVAEFSAILNGITQQLVDVSSSVHDLTQLPGIYEHDEPTTGNEQVEEHQSPRRKKTAYVVADSNDAREPERRFGDGIILADRDL
jgi:uncharacterized coiled-coil protein SlyX